MTDDAAGAPPPGNIDTTVPHSARIWNYPEPPRHVDTYGGMARRN